MEQSEFRSQPSPRAEVALWRAMEVGSQKSLQEKELLPMRIYGMHHLWGEPLYYRMVNPLTGLNLIQVVDEKHSESWLLYSNFCF